MRFRRRDRKRDEDKGRVFVVFEIEKENDLFWEFYNVYYYYLLLDYNIEFIEEDENLDFKVEGLV